MAHPAKHQLSKTYRGTAEDVFSHLGEIPPDATVELKVFEKAKRSALGGTSPNSEPSTIPKKQLRGRGTLAGVISSEDFMRRKREELDLEDRRIP